MGDQVLLKDGVLNIVDSVDVIDAKFAVEKFPERFSIVPFAQASVSQETATVQGSTLAHHGVRHDTVGFKCGRLLLTANTISSVSEVVGSR